MSVVEVLSRFAESSPVADLFFADSPAFLIEGGNGCVVIANPAAAAFVRAGTLSGLLAGEVRLRGPANARLSELAAMPDLSDTARIEMLRFFVGARAVTLPFMCQRFGAPAPQPNVYAIAAAPPASELSLADKAAIAFDNDPFAVVLFDANGERLYANPAAGEAEIAPLADLDAAEGVVRIGLDDGELTLYAARDAADLAPRPAPAPQPSIDDLPARQERGMAPIGGAAYNVVRGLSGGRNPFPRQPSARHTPAPRPAAEKVPQMAMPQAPGTPPPAEPAPDVAPADAAASAAGTKFRFVLDADAVLVKAEPALAAVGLKGGSGDSFDNLLTGDVSNLVAAIERRDTFNSVIVLWHAADGGDPVEVEIAGLPLLDGHGGYEGLRGFAVTGARRALVPGAAETAADEPASAGAVMDFPLRPAVGMPEVLPLVDEAGDDSYAEDETGETPAYTDDALHREERHHDNEAGQTPGEPAAADDNRLDEADRRAFAHIAKRLTGGVRAVHDSSADTPGSETPEPAAKAGEEDLQADDALQVADDWGDEAASFTPEDEELFEDAAAEDAQDADDADDDDIRAADSLDETTETAPSPVSAAPLAADPVAASLPDPNIVLATPEHAQPLSRGRARDANDFVALIERLPFGLMFVRDEKPLYANRAMLDLFGYADLDDLEIAGGLHSLFENLANTREPGKRMLAGVTRDGLPIELDARLQLAPWIDGPALLLTARERLDTESDAHICDLEAEVVELKDILDTATDGIVLFDNDGDIIGMNHSAEALFGMESREARGDSFAGLFSEDDRAKVEAYLEGLHDNGVASLLNDGREISAIEKGGGRIPLFLTIGRVGLGQRQKFCAVLRDITQWKRSEDELLAARNEAEQTASQKSDVLAKVSHEVRTPLNAIIGFADVMLGEQFGPLGNERYRDYLKDIKASGEHIISLVNDLLDLSKVEAGMMDMNFGQVHLNDVVEQCVAIMQGQASRERVILRTSLAPTLPDIVADVRSMRQILLNLISNAVKFTPSSGQVIVSTVYTDTGEVLLRVRDTGLGMSDEDIVAALEPYRQTPATRAAKTGTGIGLPLTKALAEANRAAFSIESKLDSGTLVQITFPSTRVLAE